ncbi:MAG: redoxin family protein [Planctomycetota bacterium]
MRTVALRSWLALAPSLLLSPACATHVEERFDTGSVAKSGDVVLGDQHGPWVYYYANGHKQAEGRYERDVQVGPWTYWYENGVKEMAGEFADERRTGPWTFWHQNGNLRARGRFERGFEIGEWTFFDAGGALERRGDFEQGKLVLRWIFFHPSGAKKAEGYFLGGVKVGTWQYWDEQGRLSEQSYPQVPGCEVAREFWDDGTLRREGFMRGGRPIGRWVSYHLTGARRLEGSFADGTPHGSFVAWDPAGALVAGGDVEAGRLTGDWQCQREGASQVFHAGEMRPAAVWTGAWSEASLAVSAPPQVVVETWLAELRSPIQKPPLPLPTAQPVSPPSTAVEAETLAKPKVPARAQPWTVRELRELPRYVESYGTGAAAGTWHSDRYDPSGTEDPPAAAHSGDRKRSTTLLGRRLALTTFRAADGSTVDLKSYLGKKNVVIAIMRGFGGQVCVYCAAQTKALAKSAQQFHDLDTEVVVVYPGPESGVEAFQQAYARTFGEDERPPYRVLYDTDLAFTKELGIVDNLARPTSLIVDQHGAIGYAYVGKNIADRPSARNLLEAAQKLGAGKP